MLSKFKWCKFGDCNLEDSFFDSLKSDYTEFPAWFEKKIAEGEKAFVFEDNAKIKAFVYLKEEDEEILLQGCNLPKEKRLKIGTLKLSDDIQGQRLGEGAIGVSLWHWQSIKVNQVYITVFEKHKKLIRMLEQFGFECAGNNVRGEKVYLKDKRYLKYDSPYKAFPYLNNKAECCGYIPINDEFHDTLFPYSELYNTKQEPEEIAAANGMTKIFIATPSSRLSYKCGEPVLIYRKHTGGQATYKSVITSYCSIIKQIDIKRYGQPMVAFDEFMELVGNKTVYSEIELKGIYNNSRNVVVLAMIYNGYLGKGKNINHKTLKDYGWFEGYPYTNKLPIEQLKSILRMGGKNVQDIIVD